jgi:hypothetical protein
VSTGYCGGATGAWHPTQASSTPFKKKISVNNLSLYFLISQQIHHSTVIGEPMMEPSAKQSFVVTRGNNSIFANHQTCFLNQ